MQIGSTRLGKIGIGLIVPVGLLAFAELWLSQHGDYNTYAVARPSEVVRRLFVEMASGHLLTLTRETLGAAITGLFFGTLIGVTCGILFGLVRPIDRLMEVTIELLRPVPFIVLIPMIMMMLGVGLKMEATAIAIGTFWPNMLMSRAAMRQIEPRLMEVSQVLGLSTLQSCFKIILPATLPRLFVAFRLALGFSLLGAVSVEITANPSGLGSAMMLAQQALQPDAMFAYIVWVALLGWGLAASLNLIETRFFGRFQMQMADR
ncbi:ABC transporter permease subunit [Rhizobium sp. Root1204]|uniref:ABC transporter permease n=1 Tax=Rhizobium sp. Root1204 TaxID=1736428 RepID=UPI000713DC4B|nr:ABC transporter permease subunit [Rhizobium sp. Root1204]KQV41305.1 hypothetical protein ASC96_18600 [Rhizobium sp. Root1204]